jgi:ABC-type Na+ efflux pump permease subunit
MDFVWTCARKDLVRRLRDPYALLLWMGIPVVLAGLILVVSGGSGGPKPRAHVLVADHDGGLLAKLLAGAFGQDGAEAPFQIERVDEPEGRARLDRGEASALLVIPEGFGDAVLEERPTALQLVTNPAQTILPGMVEEMLSVLVDGVFYAQRLVGEEMREDLRAFAKGPPGGRSVFPDFQVADFSVEVNRTIERLDRYLFPPVIRLETEVTPERAGEQEAGFGALFFPSMVFMALFFIAQGLSDDVWRERAQGTLRRSASLPRPLWALLAGKLAASAVVFAVIGVVALALGGLAFDFAPLRVAAALPWVILCGTALAAAMTLLQMYATSQRGGQLLTNLILFPLIMLGGAFFPFEAMPDWMAALGRRTPNGWALERLKGLLLGRSDPADLLPGLAVLVLALAILIWLAARRLERRFARV